MNPRMWGRWGRINISSVSLAPGNPSLKVEFRLGGFPVALCVLQEPAQPRAVVGNWEILLTYEAVLLHQLPKSLDDWCRGRGSEGLLPSLYSFR